MAPKKWLNLTYDGTLSRSALELDEAGILRKSSTIQAVVFDADGTLVDTKEFIFQAYEYSTRRNGYKVPTRAEIATQIGKRIEECYAAFAPGADYEKLIADHIAFQSENLSLIQPYDNATQVVADLRARGIKVVLWTSRRAHVKIALKLTGFETNSFDAIVDATMVDVGKPNPEGLFLGLKLVNVEPSASVMIGDAPVDIEAGKRANVAATIGVTYGFGERGKLGSAGADYLADSLQEIPKILDIL